MLSLSSALRTGITEFFLYTGQWNQFYTLFEIKKITPKYHQTIAYIGLRISIFIF